jgi:methylmalonyl-CoA/ethylmalonyl-CoA epimerase
MISHIEHIGIAVENMEKAIAYYENVLGLRCYKIEEVADQKVKTAFFLVGQTKVELLETTDPEGPIGKFIANRGPGLHHIAFAVDDVAQSLREAEEKGIRLIDKAPRKGADEMQIGFLHPKSTLGALTEFCGKK